ncbi:MAG: DUF1343 domain-containing protein [Deltaproteobacteria bacterium]|jgi:uncharacterized protein YbbC (DUF1343 family)|nr:DUF1343 domain-containing protein [Deltaproteobacteria bacterium]
MPTAVMTGLEAFLSLHASLYGNRPLGLLANQASVGPGYRHALDLLDEAMPGAIRKVFSPQHGFSGDKQDNMVESGHGLTRDGRPIHSLYAEGRKPTPAMLRGLEALVVDLADVGTRVYTFAQTLSLCLEACGAEGLEVIVLDRPNPIGGLVTEGRVLDDGCRSFVGLHPIPMRHGLTMGELAILMNGRLPVPAPLTIIPLGGWRRDMFFRDTGLGWVMPSPNLPSPETAWLYPGQVIWEGTNVSEGRGTTRPFHLLGAPFIDPDALLSDLAALGLPGLAARKASFQPTFNKWAGQTCHGLELFPLDPSFRPVLTSLSILEIVLRRWPDDFALKEPPYEYEWERRPIDLILGHPGDFDSLARGTPAADLARSFAKGLSDFDRERSRVMLY